jgi:anaerobic magnesium-protoporphyrin IX monomethyl ester cyclase
MVLKEQLKCLDNAIIFKYHDLSYLKMSNNLDLLLVNVGGTKKDIYQDLSKDFSAIETPFWAAMTADYIRDKGFEVKILDANAENLDFKETAEIIKNYNPKLTNIVAYGQHPSASTPLMSGIGKLCKEIKKVSPSLEIVLSGLHPSAFPEKTLTEEYTDFVAQGEGFHTLLGLLNEKDLSEIPGLWYKKNNKPFSNLPSPLIKDLTSELKGIAWDLLPMNKYKAHNWHCLDDLESRKSYASISTTLGCPFNCDFCCINTPFGKPSYRAWSPEWTLNQIDILVKEYGVKNIKFIDELFVLNPNHFMPIAQGLIERDYGLNIWAYARIDTTKENYLKTLKKAGINWLGLGIESGDEGIRGGVQKGKFQENNIRDIVKIIKDNGISIGANYIFGLPDDNLKSMQKTLDLAMDLNCEWANFYCAMAYPGSRLHEQAVEQGIDLPENNKDIGWEGYSQHSYKTLPLSTKNLSAKEVLKFRDEAFNEYFTNPRYLNMIENKFGINAKEHIEEMTKLKLKRKILGD